MPSPLLAPDFALPKRSDLDAKLILGAAIFGAGWGLGGFCPGPALTSLASGALPVFIFVVAMGAWDVPSLLGHRIGRDHLRPGNLPAKSTQDA